MVSHNCSRPKRARHIEVEVIIISFFSGIRYIQLNATKRQYLSRPNLLSEANQNDLFVFFSLHAYTPTYAGELMNRYTCTQSDFYTAIHVYAYRHKYKHIEISIKTQA